MVIIAIGLAIGQTAYFPGDSWTKTFQSYLLSYTFFFPFGLVGLWSFFGHAFFPEMAAKYIGWKTSPFQFEMAFTDLALGAGGIISTWSTAGFQFATILFGSIVLWGCALGHILDFKKTHNKAAGNIGIVFYLDMLVPLALWILYLT